MDEESRQKRILILMASIVCAVMIGYNAFYVPDATIAWKQASSFSISAPSGQGESLSISSAPSSVTERVSASSVISQKQGKININTASSQELCDGLAGIGETLAARIVDYREKNGPFHSTEEIKNISGIGDKIFEKIRDSITVD